MKTQALLEQTGSFHTLLINSLKDPKKAECYLQVALEEYQEDNDTAIFLTALRNIAEAQGGVRTLSEETGLTRQHLYKLLSSAGGNPRLETLKTILHAMGFHLSIGLTRTATQ